MVAAKTTDDLLTEVRDEGQLPTADGRVDAAAILRFASKRMSTAIADLLVSCRQERWVTTQADVPIVSGTASYRVPARALASGVADILIVSGDEVFDADEVSASERWRYAGGSRGVRRGPFAYAWEGDRIVLLPTPDAGGYSLRIRYPRQPARLVEVDACGEVVSATGTTITMGTLPSAWAAAETVDVVRGATPSDVITSDLAVTTSSPSTTITAAAVSSEVAAGDYVCLAGETCVPAIPEAVWPVLVAETVVACLRAIGDPGGTQDAERNVVEATVRARNVLSPRNRGARRLLVPHDSALRGGRFPMRRGR